MLKPYIKDRALITWLTLAISIKLFSLDAERVELYYSRGFYPAVSATLRFLFGWLPFSLGDILYLAAFIWLIFKTRKLILSIKRKVFKNHLTGLLFRKYLKLALAIYVGFMILWGLNYDRKGIEALLKMKVQAYTSQDLTTLATTLQDRLNGLAKRMDPAGKPERLGLDDLETGAIEIFSTARYSHRFLTYHYSSIKHSVYSPVGHLFGFTGYFNPFTSEAQLKSSVPAFIKPFVCMHEVAHQVGFAKEDEASFVAWLATRQSGNTRFLYSVYFELYRDAVFELGQREGEEATKDFNRQLHPRVKKDMEELKEYLRKNRNLVEPLMSEVYDRFLRINNQPAGKRTYSLVIAYMVAYMKKFGVEAI